MTQPDGSALARGAPVGNVEGRKLGEFIVRERLGQGGYAVIHRAEQPRLGREAVLKLMRAPPGTDGEPRRHLREALLASRFDHPYAAHVYDGGIEPDGLVWIAMELVRGCALDQILRHGPMPAPEFVPLFARICEAVQSAHDQGIIHRDLKPANVMVLERAGQQLPKLLDFGLARLRGEVAVARLGVEVHEALLPVFEAPAEVRDASPERMMEETAALWATGRGATLGSPGYMAPEQWRDAASADARTDLYALGILAYEALTGHRPFRASTPEALAEAHQRAPVPPVGPHLPAALDAVFQAALAKSPDQRFGSALELAAALSAAAGVRSGRTARRGLRQVALVAVAVALAAGALQLWRSTLPQGERRVALEVRSLGGEKDAWLAPIVKRLAESRLRDRERRFLVARDSAQANVIVRIGVTVTPAGVALEDEVARAGGRFAALPRVEGASASAAIDGLLAQLGEVLGAGRPPMQPDPIEAAAIARVGARSLEALRAYRTALSDSDGSGPDSAAETGLQALLAADPGWAHPYALLSLVQGMRSPRSDATVQAGLAAADRARDRSGVEMLEAISLLRKGQTAEAVARLEPLFRADPDEVVGGYYLALAQSRLGHTDQREAVMRQLYRRRPDLQFGVELIGHLRSSGRAAEADALAVEWVGAAPESGAAQGVLIGVEVAAGRFADAQARARRLLLVYGEQPARSQTLCDVLILGGQLEEARKIAQRALLGAPVEQADAQYRLGLIGVLEGRFAAAFSALATAYKLSKETGHMATMESLAPLRSLAPLVAPEQLALYDEELASFYDNLGSKDMAEVLRLEGRLHAAHPGGCPDLDAPLAGVPDGLRRQNLRRYLLRAASAVGCASCSDVVRAGRDANEYSTESVLRFAICAEQEGALPLARDALAVAQAIGLDDLEGNLMLASPFTAMLARFHLGRVRAALGDRAGARSEYETFLAHWEHADRPVREVDDARRALEALR